MKIREMFQAKIDREITGVVKVGQHDEKVKAEELREYVITRELTKHFEEFFSNYAKSIKTPTDNMGVWISGFFGSGKSHFLKILSYVLDNDSAEGKSAIDYFTEKDRISSNPMLLANMKLASETPTKAILFNVDSKSEATGKSDSNAIVLVFNRVFNEKLGYIGSNPVLADLERSLDEDGRYDEFKELVKVETGKAWEDERHKFKLRRNQIKNILVKMNYMTEEDATLWINESVKPYAIAIEDFAQKVADYIDRSGERVVFLVDEIGQFIAKESKLMLNLQTMTEELGNRCKGKAWVIVTSQEDIDSMTDNLKSDGSSANDVSKIQGRFATRLSLSSVNADEVIRERILKKNTYGADTLKAIYQEKEMTLRNVLEFETQTYLKKFDNEKEFVEVYPFVPYQFDLLADVLNAIRLNSSTGKHLSEGERSMLGAFQAAAKEVKDREDGVLVPFYRFYDDLVKFLDHTHNIVITRAQDNPNINPEHEKDCFNVNVLKTLFLLKYVKGVPLTVKNLVSLMITDIEEDRQALKNRIQKALDILVDSLLVSEMQGEYEFLTDEEQDINRQIQERNIQMQDVIKAVTNMVFDQIYPNSRYKLNKMNGRYTFAINQMVDTRPRKGNQNGEIGLRFLTPWYSEGGQVADSRNAQIMSYTSSDALFLLPTGTENYLKELREALKIDDYINSVADSQKGRTTIIRQVKIQESARHKAAALDMLKEAIGEAELFISGNAITDIKTKDAQTKISQALEKLVDVRFSKLSYIDKAMEDSDIRELFDGKAQTKMGIEPMKDPNVNAIQEVREYIKLNTAGHMAISLKTIMDQFTKAPYGYIDADVKWLVAKIFKDGVITASVDKEPITLFNRKTEELTSYFTGKKYQEKLLFLPKDEVDPKKLKAAKDVSKELFKFTVTTSDADRLQQDLFECCNRLYSKCDKCLGIANTKPEYPGKEELKTVKDAMNKFTGISQQKEFFDKIYDMQDDLIDMAMDLDPVLTFYENETQRKLFDDYGLRALQHYETSKEHIVNAKLEENIAKIKAIVKNKRPYTQIKDLPKLYEEFMFLYSDVLAEKARPVKQIIEQDKESLLSALEGKPYEEKYKAEIIEKFRDLKDRVEESSDISWMLGFKDKADSLTEQYLNKFDNEETYPTPEGGQETGGSSVADGESGGDVVKPSQKKKINVFAKTLTSDWVIKDQEDLDKYLNQFRKQIEDRMEDDQILKIHF